MHLQGEIPIWEFHWKPGAQCLGCEVKGTTVQLMGHMKILNMSKMKRDLKMKRQSSGRKNNILSNVHIVGSLSFEASLGLESKPERMAAQDQSEVCPT